ncbi:MAG: NifB/NifX family molybdenum-iron cluster-binding protein [Candidatus Omnitrophica bacterium]|nr:NifB/NifX family molybdenum-iron cluster-binding protein [Candidatus Omnitrophota bacterium]MBU2221559.1 NifB/NifX family molybdenum-iron cluster-binding protein [Candidatus Omnitrophota bacterium]MBU2257717.1 NifB/NifX family molybdenum-iron cluster-binding protein [Candidatus Omnitrophota bacterium]
MKIYIPTETKDGLKAKAYGHFGSAPFFTIYETEKETFESVDNTNSHHSHGMCHPIGVLGAYSIDAVVCQGMGARAVQNLNQSNIKVFRAAGETVADIIKKFKSGELEEITVGNACTQHGCH